MTTLKSTLRRSIRSLGGLALSRYLNQNRLRIVMYHRFSQDSSALAWQCEHIVAHYRPLTLHDLVLCSKNEVKLPPNSLVVTIDDGYRDFLDYGHPVFRHFKIPCTLYPVTDFIDGKIWLWWNQLDYAFAMSRTTSISFAVADREFTASFKSPEERLTVGRDIAERLTKVDDSERRKNLKLIPQLLEVDIPSSPPSEFAPLNWDEVRQLSRQEVTLGAHTKTHPILSRIEGADRKREEIEGSKLRLEQEIGEPVNHFCYPNGNTDDFDDVTVSLVKACGFQTATTTVSGLNSSNSDPLLLRRLGVEPNLPRIYFEELLSGARKH
jgi:peptidoglycan/xylan/chitin deacetylase (PgdA/CDA1 family)